ncbi:MAG: hypothetical protein A4E55_00558 [Pelotomaculum sp. PtaU1.Bin035]|nr:MAG: hypothetical protein A4E55_00558 [Pelotomaculum sp. PtaU1.Bin035]
MSGHIREPKEDTRSVLGRLIDKLGGFFLIWLVSFILLINLTGKLAIAWVLSVPPIVAGALVLKKFFGIREQKRKLQRQLWLANQKLMEDILKMDPKSEFKPYVRDILAELPGFHGLMFKSDWKNEKAGGEHGIDLEGFYKGVPVAVHCKRNEGDKKITPGDIRKFAGSLYLEDYENGLFITSGEFGPGVTRVVTEFSRKGTNIKLINRYGLLDLARRAGFNKHQGREVSPGRCLTTTGERRAAAIAALRDSAFSSKKNAKSYFGLGILLYAGYILLRGTTTFGLVYLSFAVLNIFMGAYCLHLGRRVGEVDPLEGLVPDRR